ncbi:MAG: transporter substrate-binding domain-containing protein [Granulosicoccus sp.]|nr:transporter substrate-binding domain-containing protein [Granulosicoccus sp.]
MLIARTNDITLDKTLGKLDFLEMAGFDIEQGEHTTATVYCSRKNCHNNPTWPAIARQCIAVGILLIQIPRLTKNMPHLNNNLFQPARALMVALLSACLMLCGPSVAADSVLTEILSSGKLKFGTTGDWDPMSVKDPATNSYQGYDIDVAAELAKDLEVDIEFVPTDWKSLVSGVTAGKYHITGSASISPGRAKAAGYTNSYFALHTVPLTLKKNADRFLDWDDLNDAEVTVAATLGTTQEKQVKEFFPESQHKIIEAPARDFQEVLAGRADAHITSNVEASKLVAKYPEMMIVPVSQGRARTPIAMLLPQADQVWINYMNTWIALKTEQGFFDELALKWQLATIN